MPELPEVETTRRGIAPSVVGQRVTGVIVRDVRLRWPVSPHLGAILHGRKVVAVDRRAKYLIFRLDNGGDLLVHLGMSGRLCILPAPRRVSGVAEAHAHGPHDHVELQFTSGKALRFTDPRRFGAFLLAPDGAEQHPRLVDLGPEPLGPDFDGAYLFARARGRKVAVKQFLMDAHIVVGVGNIYANEALFLAGIRPTVPAGRISRERFARLVIGVRQTLTQAIEAGGTSFRDFVGGDGKPGYFSQSLTVYGREGLPCVRCERALQEARLGGRATVFCGHCQR